MSLPKPWYSHICIICKALYMAYIGPQALDSFLDLVPLWIVYRTGIKPCWLHSQQGVQWLRDSILTGFYIKTIVEKFEVELQWVLLLCMYLTLSHVKLIKALRSDSCIALLVGFFSSLHQASRRMCLVMGRWKRALQRHSYLLAVCAFLCSPGWRKLAR